MNGMVGTDSSAAPVTYDIPEVEIFRAGAWTDSAGRTVTYTAEDIEGMAEASRELEGRFEAPVKLGHDPEQPLLETDGLPAAGWLRNVRAAGGRLFADLAGVPKKVYELIRTGGYKKRSLEVLHNYRDEATGRVYGHVAAGLALLGARLPAIGSLDDIRALYGCAPASDTTAYLYESGPDGIGAVVVIQQQTVDSSGRSAPEAERIVALETRVEELEALLGEAAAAGAQDAENDTEAPDTGEVDGVPAPGEDQAGEDVSSSGGATDEDDAAPIEGTPIETDAVTAVDSEEAATVESEIENVANVDNTEEAVVAAEVAERESALDAKEAVIREAAEKLSAALAELEGFRRRESERRARAREEFLSRHAAKLPPAHRAIVQEVLALLEGDFALVSDYSRGESQAVSASDAFRGFIESLPEHPAMSEYGRERADRTSAAAGGGADRGEGADLDGRIRAYCAEWGLNPDAAGDYASAALAILEYERPPSLNERACVCAEPPAGLRSGNKDFSVSLAEPRKAEYTVSMNSTPNGSGCTECGRRADGGDDAAYGWRKDLERGVKNERKEVQREVREQRDKIIHKTVETGVQAAIQYFAHKLRVIDDEYYKCKETSTGPKEKSLCDPIARGSISKLVERLEELPKMSDKLIGELKVYLLLVKYTEYPVVKKNVIDLITSYYPECAGYFRF